MSGLRRGLQRVRFALRFLQHGSRELGRVGGFRSGRGGASGFAGSHRSGLGIRCGAQSDDPWGEPTIHLASALELVASLPDALPVVWKTNAHGTPESHALLDGVFDAWVADLKFGNDDCARRIARVERYCSTVHDNLRWAAGHTRLIVRHLLLPGHLDCCWRPAAAWLAEQLPQAEVSLRTGFWPGWFSHRHPELKAPGPRSEAQEAVRIWVEAGLRLIE